MFISKLPMEKVFEEMMRVNDPVLTKVAIGRMPVPKPGLKADLIGICGSPGVDEGPAKVLYSAEQIGELQAGDILVAPLTYTPVGRQRLH